MESPEVDHPHASDDERRRDRQMIELLNELRVAMPGVQILFGFLLTVPFASGFERVTDFQRAVYFLTVVLVTVATACLIAPSAAHRVRFHQRDRTWLVEHANRMLIAGLVALGLALVSAIVLITDYLYDGVIVPGAAAFVGVMLAGLWFVRPAVRR